MKFVRDWINGLKFASGFLPLVWLLFLVNAVLGLLIARPVYNILRDAISHTVIAKELLVGYHHGFITDVLREHGIAIQAATGGLGLISFLSIVVGSFMASGAISNFYVDDRTNWDTFFRGANAYFKPYLILSLLHILGQAIALFLWLTPAVMIVGINPDQIVNETLFFQVWGLTLLLFLPLSLFFALFFDYAKIIRLQPDGNYSAFQALKKSWQILRNKPFRPFALILFHGLLILSSLILYYAITSNISWIGFGAIAIFILQQLVVWLRTFAKLILYSGELLLSKELSV